MNIAYWITIISCGIFLWQIMSIFLFPVRALSSFLFPGVVEIINKPIINETRHAILWIYTQIAMKALLILFCVAVIFILIAYVIYFVAKFILLKEPLTAPTGKAILELPVIKEFTDIGMFPFFDNILAYRFPALYGGSPTSPMGAMVINFAKSFIQKIQTGDEGSEIKPEEPTTRGEVNNPNLSDEDNKAVNAKFDKCMDDNTPGAYNGIDPIKLLINQLNTSKGKIKCEIDKIKDYTQVKRVE